MNRRTTEVTVSDIKEMIKARIERYHHYIERKTEDDPENKQKAHIMEAFCRKQLFEDLLSDIYKEEAQYELYCRAHNIKKG